MKIIELMHRWTGGLVGLLLAVLGLSGALLVHKHSWIVLPHSGDRQIQDVSTLARTVTRLFADPNTRPQSIGFASADFGVHRLRFAGEAGAYANQSGAIVTQWDSKWDRPELWLFDLHHYLWAGETGAIVAGWLALIGLGFVVTGAMLWWRSRKTFQPRLWPARMSRPAIVRHHRDLGIILAPLLLLSMLTGAMLTLRPLANLLLSPWSSADEMRQAGTGPALAGGALGNSLNWRAMLGEAKERFPPAEFRMISLPKKPGELIVLRMKQPDEWLPNGRTMLWFDPADGRLVEARDAFRLPAGSKLFNTVYPLHAASIGGLPYKLALTTAGLGLSLLGSLAVWIFWFGQRRTERDYRRAMAKWQG
jgi:uncharacterized iron-regulated membrane protein